MYLNIEILDLEIQFFQKLAYLGVNFFNREIRKTQTQQLKFVWIRI